MYTLYLKRLYMHMFNPLTPRSDQYVNSPHRQVMRIKHLDGCNSKFSGLANREMYGHQLGELAFRSWE